MHIMSDSNTTDSKATRETIGHDEFDPTGTLTLIALYFVLLVVMWLFTYFVEFLGNHPTPTIVT